MGALLRALTRIPLPAMYAIAWVVYCVAFRVMRWRREQVERDVANAFPEKDAVERDRIVREAYRRTADTLLEAFWGFGASADALKRRVTIENPGLVRDSFDAGQSVVLLTAHFANWEWLLLGAGVHFGIPIDVVYQPQRASAVDGFLRRARERFGSTLIPREEFIFDLMSRGGALRTYAIIADQTPRPEHPKHWTLFLNQDTAFFTGAGKIARFLDAKVLYVGMRRLKRGRYAVRLSELAAPPYAAGEDALIVEHFARALETAVREDPAGFLWLQKKWKYPKPEAEPETRRRSRRPRAP